MPSANALQSHILISDAFDEQIERLQADVAPKRLIRFVEDELLVEHVRKITAEAYLAEKEDKYLVIAAKRLSVIAQNALLKLLEEPPSLVHFIIITPSKSALLPTVRSRLPVIATKLTAAHPSLDISLQRLDLQMMYSFLKEHERLRADEAQQLLYALMHHAVSVENMLLTKQQSDAFALAFELVLKHARFQSVLLALLGTFLKRR